MAAMAAWPSTLLGPEGTDARWSPSDWTDLSPYGLGRALLILELLSERANRGTRRSRGRDRPYFENCIVDASIICSSQVIKGTRWMPWYQEPKKDVGACDKPRGVGNQTSIRGFPNGETH